jgi:hypothetical protein
VHTLSLKLVDTGRAPVLFDSFPASQKPSYSAEFDFGGPRYEVATAPSPGCLALHRGWQSWAVLAAGALSTGLLGGLLLLGTGHTWTAAPRRWRWAGPRRDGARTRVRAATPRRPAARFSPAITLGSIAMVAKRGICWQ